MVTLILQLLLDGMASGLVYVILAAGLVLILSVPRIFLIAYGQFYMIGAYVVWGATVLLELPYLVSLLLATLITALLSMTSYWLIFRHIHAGEKNFLAMIVAAMGLMLILGQAGLLAFGTSSRGMPAIFTGVLSGADLSISVEKVVIMSASVAVTIVLFLLYEKTKIGRAMRAVACNPEAASLQGIDVTALYLVTMGVSGALAGFAGGMIAPAYGINPEMGNHVILTVLLVVMLGGMNSLVGAVVGGIIFGITLSLGQYFVPDLAQIILFTAIGVIILIRPAGLLGSGVSVDV
jgi:branched-chain amino acid transport system permease protein